MTEPFRPVERSGCLTWLFALALVFGAWGAIVIVALVVLGMGR